MTNQEVIQDLSKAKIAALRHALSIVVRSHAPSDIIEILSEVMDDESMRYAQRTGDYSRAADMSVIADYLEGLDHFLENYDPTPE